MKKLFFLLAFSIAAIVTPAQLSKNLFSKTFTFTTSSQTSSYTAGFAINQYTASKTAYSLDIGVPYTSLVGIDVVTTHTGTPLLAVNLFTGSLTMPGDNLASITLSPTDLSTNYLTSVSIGSTAVITGTGSTVSNSYSQSSIPPTAFFVGRTLFFVLTNTVANGTPSSGAQYVLRFTFKKE